MGQLLLLLVVAVTVAAVVFGVTVLATGRDPGLVPTEADGRAVPLPGDRPLRESDVGEVRFDTALRGYRMAQVDQALRRAAYDIGYKTELIGVLEAEVTALREGRTAEADALRSAREQSASLARGPAADADAANNGAVTIDLDEVDTESDGTAAKPQDVPAAPEGPAAAPDGVAAKPEDGAAEPERVAAEERPASAVRAESP
ncbi:DivIVA domain-containing protein [Micromonospora zingiberis]|uniref:DivIVA domain-containing protein n=1 Tax=Micromonospora zingiberis TaxID=2053011 RepID=A0A4R0GS31_9ACTN|nr:DivIVA domain-containing protein [Micromonospora zingiberis]TCB99672.1 DivIVA domain-containing protein [Micromonospora zingiberis]